MDESLRNYLSTDEQEQIDALIEKALYRKERKKKSISVQKQFQYFVNECIDMENIKGKWDADVRDPLEEDYLDVGIKRILRGICGLCLKHGMCPCAYEWEGRKKKECMGAAADEELPL